MIHKVPVRIADDPAQKDQAAASGKGVGPMGSVELGRAKYWNGSFEATGAEAAEPLKEESTPPTQPPSYFREAMTGYGEPAVMFEPDLGP